MSRNGTGVRTGLRRQKPATVTTTVPGPRRAPLLQQVRSRLFVAARRRSRSLLEGEYASVFHGRSIDYDDLREYVPGDEVRDIDWKATARHGSPLVRRYVAARKQNIMFVVDTGRGMAASAPSGESKKDIAVLVCGVIGHLAQRHGDLVGLVHGTSTATEARTLRGTESHLELLLREIDGSTHLTSARSDLTEQLRWVARHVKRRLVLVVVADDRDLDEHVERLLRRLHVQHEILWVTIRDASPTDLPEDADPWDVDDDYALPTGIRLDPKVVAEYAALVTARRERTAAMLRRHGIVEGHVAGSAEVLGAVFSLLDRHRRAR